MSDVERASMANIMHLIDTGEAIIASERQAWLVTNSTVANDNTLKTDMSSITATEGAMQRV